MTGSIVALSCALIFLVLCLPANAVSSGDDAFVINTKDTEVGLHWLAFNDQSGRSKLGLKEGCIPATEIGDRSPVASYVVDGQALEFIVGLEDSRATGVTSHSSDEHIYVHRGALIGIKNGALIQHLGSIEINSGKTATKLVTPQLSAVIPPHSSVASYVDERGLNRLVIHSGSEKVQITPDGKHWTELDENTCLYREQSRLCLAKMQKPASSRHRGKLPAAVRLFAAHGTGFTVQADKTLTLTGGWITISAPACARIKTKSLLTSLSNQATLNLEALPDIERIGVCTGIDSVKVSTGGIMLPLTQGQELLVSRDELGVRQLTAIDGVMRRSPAAFTLDDGSKGLIDYFSTFSLLAAAEHLRPLRAPSCKANKDLRDQLLKASAVNGICTNARGPYLNELTLPTQLLASRKM